MKKGFTLVELLAVIVILAVILTISVPAVKKTVDNAKKKSAENDALMIKNIAEKYYTSNLDKDEEITGIDLSSDTLSYSGKKPTKGYLYFTEDGIAYGKMYINGYCVEVKSDGTNTSEKVSIDDCNIADISTGGNTSGGNQGGSGSTEVTKTYTNGTVVYYNPETNKKCSSSEAVSTTGTKTGCMRWYTFNDEGNDTVNLLLDHNTTATVAWVSKEDYIAAGGTETEYGSHGNNSKGPITALKQLKSDTSSWNKSINPRLIEVSEITTITGNNGWDDGEGYYYFHTNSTTRYSGDAGTNKYAWLFDNTYECTTYGCNVADNGYNRGYNYGYWTNTAYSYDSGGTLSVYYVGGLTLDSPATTDTGVRPVVTISKSIIS